MFDCFLGRKVVMDLAMKINKSSRVRVSRSIQSLNSYTKLKYIKKKIIIKPKQIKNRCLCNETYDVLDFSKVWSELREHSQLCDGVVKCADGVSINVHRPILAAISPYFKTLFLNRFKGGSPAVELLLEDVTSDILNVILDFAYTGKCKIDETNVEKLLPIADQLDCVGVVQQCCQFLLNELQPYNCLGIFKFARDYFCTDLQTKGWSYIRNNFMEVLSNNREFEELTFEEIFCLLSDDHLNTRSEESVFDAITLWINKAPEERIKHLHVLLQCVRFGLMNLQNFESVVKSFPHLNDESRNIVNTAENLLQKIADKTVSELNVNQVMTRPRIPHEIVFAIGGWSAGSPTNFVETYDVRADRWFLSVHTDTQPRAYHGLVSLNNLIYVIGGFDGDEHFNSVRCFDPVKKEWSEVACMYHPRCYVSVCVLDGEIYAIGGFNGRTRLSSVEKYNPGKNQWEQLPPMRKQRSDASAAALNGKIYVAGGFNGTEVLKSVEVYHPDTRQWTYITPMSTPRSGVSLLEHKGCLYALGGFNGTTRLKTGEKYNPLNSYQWEPIPNMSCYRSNFATVVTDELIFVIGGFDGTTTISLTECYDDETKEWFEVAPMNLNRSALSACICKGLPNCYEYSYTAKAKMQSVNSPKPNNSGDGYIMNNASVKTNYLI